MDVDLEDTLKYKDFVLKYVRVKTVDKKVHEGWLKSIDPETGNLILLNLNDENGEVENCVLLTNSACKNVDVIREGEAKTKSVIQKLYFNEIHPLSKETLIWKEALVTVFKSHRLPVRESENDEALIVCDSVTIYPPYNAESCISTNGRVLLMIRNLVSDLSDKKINI